MQPFFEQDNLSLYCGDLREVLPTLPEASVDFVVTDPPYGIGFMEKDWDHEVPGPEYWRAVARVCKPGALLLAFGGPRTYHRLICAIEDAGWEIRDCLMWLYGQGMPKCGDIGKLIDKSKGAERQVIGDKLDRPGYHLHEGKGTGCYGGGNGLHAPGTDARLRAAQITAPATPEAAKWTGWAMALKPAVEYVVAAQKSPASITPVQAATHRRLCLIEDQLWRLSYARIAADTSTADRGDGSVAALAALPATIRAVLFDQTDTSLFASVMNLSLNIVRSWQNILADSFDPTSTSTTETAIKPTIDWKTLSCCASATTPGDIIQAAMAAHGSKCDVSPAVRYFNAVAMSLCATRELSVLAGATWPQRIYYQDEGGLGLCPDWRPIVLAMKPLDGTIAYNALTWGVAGMNIDACRIGTESTVRTRRDSLTDAGWASTKRSPVGGSECGRWPANLLLDEEAAAALDAQTGPLTSGTNCVRTKSGDGYHGGIGKAGDVQVSYGDSGGASRFFYCSKATRKERGPGNDHATVKPLALMEYLLTLLSTPDGGVILDPFAGSGTTLLAAKRLGRRCIGVELTEHNCEIARGRLHVA